MRLLTTTALTALLLAPAAFAQGQPAAAPPSKIGVLNVTAAVFNTAEGKQGMAELQSRFAPQQTELQNLQRQIQDAQRRLQEGQSNLSEEEKTRLSGQIEIWSRSGQRKGDEMQEMITFERNDLGGRILKKMDAVIERYAQENALAVIIDVSSQNVPFWSPQVEITQDIIRAYDAANPVGAAAQTPRPAAQPGQTRPKPPGQQ